MHKKYIVKLSRKERATLQTITKKGKNGVRVIKRAMVLAKSDQGKGDGDIAKEVGISERSVQRIRKRYQKNRLERALYDAPRPGQPPKITNEAESYLVALACSSPPKGEERWTLQLLKQHMVKARKVTDTITTVALWQRLDRRGIKPWREKNVVHSYHH